MPAKQGMVGAQHGASSVSASGAFPMWSRISVWTALLAAVVFVVGPANGARGGRPAPGFKLITLDHQKYSLADLRGKVVVLNFWATWCAPCKAELAAMNNYARRHSGEGLAIFAIKTDD